MNPRIKPNPGRMANGTNKALQRQMERAIKSQPDYQKGLRDINKLREKKGNV